MTWTVKVEHGEAVARKSGRVVALEVLPSERVRIWSYDNLPGPSFFERAWIEEETWWSDPHFEGVEEVIEQMIKKSPGLSEHAKLIHLGKIWKRKPTSPP